MIVRNPARWWLILAALGVLLLLVPQVAQAHERRDVGPYQFVVGFMVEPAYEGLKNGVDLRVQLPPAAEGEAPAPVEGVQETLQVEVTHVPSGASQVMPLRTIFGSPGRYTADLIPTAPGQYRFRFFGTIEGLAVDEVFESGPGRFNDIEPATAIHFPEPVPEMREVGGAVRGLQSAVEEAQDAARRAEASLAGAQRQA